MKIAITGATGFVGLATVARLLAAGHELVCLHRKDSDTSLLPDSPDISLIEGDLSSIAAGEIPSGLLESCDAIVHSALWRPGKGFRGAEGDLVEFARINMLGSLQLMDAAREAGVERFVFVSTCAVHEQILDDRPLDEAHPLWPMTHYGAHKAAIEKFVHSFGLGMGYGICALRPTGIYGVARPVGISKWFSLIKDIVDGRDVSVSGGGKEVCVLDVAKAIEILLNAQHDQVAGQSFACYDQYVARYQVATLAKDIAQSNSTISGEPRAPKHQIETGKIRNLGMEFGGDDLLNDVIGKLVEAAQN
ncbi:MAG: NAD(P)-dependent oxidoreductase [Planctomycetota bacterium]